MKDETAQCARPENTVADFPQLGEVVPVVRLVFLRGYSFRTQSVAGFLLYCSSVGGGRLYYKAGSNL